MLQGLFHISDFSELIYITRDMKMYQTEMDTAVKVMDYLGACWMLRGQVDFQLFLFA